MYFRLLPFHVFGINHSIIIENEDRAFVSDFTDRYEVFVVTAMVLFHR